MSKSILKSSLLELHSSSLLLQHYTFRPISCNLQTFRDSPGQQTAASFATIQLPLQKLLFSATMTHSPEKLAPLQLYQPILFTATGSGGQLDQGGVSTAGMK